MNTNNHLPESIQPGETLAGVQLCPFGEFPNGKTLQVCDETAFNKLVEAFNAAGAKEVLCDFEHKSEDPSMTSDTAAAAWISNLSVNKERGLVGDLKFTDLGAEAVTNRRLRFLSPVWTLDADGRPDRLRSVALTNKPNIPVACVLNRELPAPAVGGGTQPAVKPVEEEKGPEMDKLKELLELAPEATEEDILAAIVQLKEQVAAANKEKEEAEAESFAEEHKAVCNKDALKSAYLMNKDAAKALVAGLVKPEQKADAPKQVVLNKDTVATPALKLNKAQEGLAACKTPAERCNYIMAHAKELAEAD